MNFKHLRQLTTTHQFILGSASPRRKKLLAEIDISFEIIRPTIEEEVDERLTPQMVAESLSLQKAQDVASHCSLGQVVMGCDTIVLLNDIILGKPKSETEAASMLARLSGKKHTVCSAISLLIIGGPMISSHEQTRVLFNELTTTAITEYIATGEPMDKAGAYGIQGIGGFLVDSIEGNLDTVIGLPRLLLEAMAGELLSKL